MNITSNSAFSVCGTPEYLAPEILYKQGHGKPVDWWCLGSLIYEMVVGLPPFYSKSRPELFDKIKFGNPNIPTYISQNLRHLLTSLFHKNP
jgi:serine/threonine protein kinase